MDDNKLAQFKEVFSLFDKNGDGYITANELGTVMESFGNNPTEIELRDVINEVDFNSNGVIDFYEFIDVMTRKNVTQENDEDVELKEAFLLFDLDKNGFMDKNELKTLMINLGEELNEDDLNRIFDLVDMDHNGKLDYKEFKEFLNSI